MYADRITLAVYNELKGWESADKAPATYSYVTQASQVHLMHPAVAATQAKAVVSSSKPAIQALDGWWNPVNNIFSNMNCVVSNMYNGYWGSGYYPQNWQQVWAPAPNNCIYNSSTAYSPYTYSYNDSYDYSYDDSYDYY